MCVKKFYETKSDKIIRRKIVHLYDDNDDEKIKKTANLFILKLGHFIILSGVILNNAVVY